MKYELSRRETKVTATKYFKEIVMEMIKEIEELIDNIDQYQGFLRIEETETYMYFYMIYYPEDWLVGNRYKLTMARYTSLKDLGAK